MENGKGNRGNKTQNKDICGVLRPKDDIILEAKRVILIEHLDKLANTALANELTNEKNKNADFKSDDLNNLEQKLNKNDFKTDSFERKLKTEYFLTWRKNATSKSKSKDKIDQFFQVLNARKDDLRREAQSQERAIPSVKVTEEKKHSADSFKHRFDAQRSIIEVQKAKLRQQEKLIDDLKLGIVRDETKKSLESSKSEIREIFRKCSSRIQCKITPPAAIENDVDLIQLRCNTVPKLVQRMEKRAEERALKRRIILERKAIMDDLKKKNVEEAIVNKKVADEEQRLKNLEAIKEKRRLEGELEKRRQMNKRKYLECLRKVDRFRNRKLKRLGFTAFKLLLRIKANNELKSELLCRKTTLIKFVFNWKLFVRWKMEEEAFEADRLYLSKVLKKTFGCWRSVLMMRKQSLQVAEDLYDMRLESRIFIHWHRYVCVVYMKDLKNWHLAENHYISRTLLQYFYQWKSLPAVVQLEKAKEEKKRRWRQKVLEILPDYKPHVDD